MIPTQWVKTKVNANDNVYNDAKVVDFAAFKARKTAPEAGIGRLALAA